LGVHNIENIMAALATTLLMGCDARQAQLAVENFSGLHHRMELVRVLNDVAYYNDSKGTNVGSVVKSLDSFAGKVTLIAGGKDKGGDYAPLANLVKDRVSHLILLGEARQRIYQALQPDRYAWSVPEEAVAKAQPLSSPEAYYFFLRLFRLICSGIENAVSCLLAGECDPDRSHEKTEVLTIVLMVVAPACFGVVMVYSTSSVALKIPDGFYFSNVRNLCLIDSERWREP
jgi:UDP-N-acetylmuramoylalanine--D-glutamate ligase